MLKGDYTPIFRLALAAKDARLAVDAGEEAGAEIPVIEAIAAQMTAVAAEHPDEDLAVALPRHRPTTDPAGRLSGRPAALGNLSLMSVKTKLARKAVKTTAKHTAHGDRVETHAQAASARSPCWRSAP